MWTWIRGVESRLTGFGGPMRLVASDHDGNSAFGTAG
jgi:hypothetical protein